MKALSDKAANVFLQAGIARGDRVMVILKRHYEYWIAAVALHKIGAVLMPVTHMLTVRTCGAHSDPGSKAVVCTPDDAVPDRITQALKEEGTACLLWTVREDREDFQNLTEQIQAGRIWSIPRREHLRRTRCSSTLHREPRGIPRGCCTTSPTRWRTS